MKPLRRLLFLSFGYYGITIRLIRFELARSEDFSKMDELARKTFSYYFKMLFLIVKSYFLGIPQN